MPDALVFAALAAEAARHAARCSTSTTPSRSCSRPSSTARPNHPLVRLIRAEERVSAALADGHIFVTAEARDLLRAARHRRRAHAGRHEHSRRARLRRAPRRRSRRPPTASCGSSTTAASPTASGSRPWSGRWRCCAAAASRSRSTSTAPTPRRPRSLAATAAEVAPDGVRIAPQPTPVEEIPSRLAEAAPRRRADPARRLHRAAAAGQAARVRPHGPAGGRLAPAGDRALLRRRRAARRAGRPGLDRRRDRRRAQPSRSWPATRAERASQRLAEIEWRPAAPAATWSWSTAWSSGARSS